MYLQVFHIVHFECPASSVEAPVIPDKALPCAPLHTTSDTAATAGDNPEDPAHSDDEQKDGGDPPAADRLHADNDTSSEVSCGGRENRTPPLPTLNAVRSGAPGNIRNTKGTGNNAAGGNNSGRLVTLEHGASGQSSPKVTVSESPWKKNDNKSQFEMMAESNRQQTSVDVDKINSTIALVASDVCGNGSGYISGNGNGHIGGNTFWRRHASFNSNVANASFRRESTDDLFYGVGGNVARDILNPPPSTASQARRSLSRPEYFDTYRDDHHPAGEIATDYASLGARPRRRFFRNNDVAPEPINRQNNTISPFYNSDAGYGYMPSFANNSQISGSGIGPSASVDYNNIDRTDHSSPSHSEYSYTRSSASPTRSENSNHSTSCNNHQFHSATVALGESSSASVPNQPDSNGAEGIERLPDAEPILVESSPESPAYHRPTSPISREPAMK